jgi:hypothetical protein
MEDFSKNEKQTDDLQLLESKMNNRLSELERRLTREISTLKDQHESDVLNLIEKTLETQNNIVFTKLGLNFVLFFCTVIGLILFL